MIRTILFCLIIIFIIVHSVSGQSEAKYHDKASPKLYTCCIIDIVLPSDVPTASGKAAPEKPIKTERWSDAFPKAPANTMTIDVLNDKGITIKSGWTVDIIKGIPSINLTNLANGTYTITLTSGGKVARRNQLLNHLLAKSKP